MIKSTAICLQCNNMKLLTQNKKCVKFHIFNKRNTNCIPTSFPPLCSTITTITDSEPGTDCLSSAFDTISHSILILSIGSTFIGPKFKSHPLQVNSGVPQGSVLSLLLFLWVTSFLSLTAMQMTHHSTFLLNLTPSASKLWRYKTEILLTGTKST